MNLQAYRAGVEEYLAARALEDLARLEGEGGEAPEPALRRHADLFSAEAVAELWRLAEEEGPGSGLAWLAEFAAEGRLELAAEGPLEALRAAEVRWGLPDDDGRIPWPQARRRLARAAQRDRRLRWAGWLERIAEERAACRREVDAARERAAAALGLPPPARRWEWSRGRSFPEVVSAASSLLRQTREAYRRCLERCLWEREGLTLGEATYADLPRFLRAATYDELLPGADPAFFRYVALSLGTEEAHLEAVRLDVREVAEDRADALWLAPRLPGRIVAVIDPVGGLPDTRALLRLVGYTLPAAATGPELPVEARRLGDPAIRGLYAGLFEALLLQRRWLERGLNRPVPNSFLRLVRLCLLLRTRALAARLVAPAEGPAGGAGARRAGPPLAEALSDATGFHHPEADLLPGEPDLWAAADELSAWLAVPPLADLLGRRYGHLWAASPSAGRFLRDLWETGTALGLEGVRRLLGLGPVAAEPLVDEWLSPLR